MQSHNRFLKSIMPVQIYKSSSAVYMTCLSKISISAFVPECNQKLVVEKAIVQALDESIMPQAYANRQQEAEELLHRSQTNFRKVVAARSTPVKKVQWGKNTKFWINNQLEVERPISDNKMKHYERVYRAHCRNQLERPILSPMPPVRLTVVEFVKVLCLLFILCFTFYLMGDVSR